MSGANKAIIMGRLGSDPKIRSTSSGKKVATLSVATSPPNSENTQWHRIVLWEKKAELADEYLRKGDRVYVEGRIKYRSYETDAGETRHVAEIVAYTVEFIDMSGGLDERERVSASSVPSGGDDLPF